MTLKLTEKNPRIFELNKYANEVVQSFDRSIRTRKSDKGQGYPQHRFVRKDTHFLSVPLRARLLAEVYQEEVKKAYKENKISIGLLENDVKIKIGSLIKKFITRKFEIYFHEKALVGEGLDEDSKQCLMMMYSEAYEILALRKLFDSEKIKLFTNDKKEFFSINILSRIGLIHENEESVNFIHRTFAEYFAGKWLAEHSKNVEVKKFLSTELFKKHSRMLLCVFDYFCTHNLPLHKAILEDNFPDFKQFLFEKSCNYLKDDIGRTALHLATQEGRSGMIRSLLIANCDILTQDQFGKTALHYAANFGQNIAIDLLLKNKIDIDLKRHIFRTPILFDVEIGTSLFIKQKSVLLNVVNMLDEDGKPPLYYAVDDEYWDPTCSCSLILYGSDVSSLTIEQKKELILCILTQKSPSLELDDPYFVIFSLLLMHVPEAFQYLNRFIYPYTICYFFKYGHTKVIDILLKTPETVETILDIVNKSPDFFSDLLKENNTRNDADNLRVIRYTLEQGKDLGFKIPKIVPFRLINEVESRGFSECFKYLYKYIVSEQDNFKLDELLVNKMTIYTFFCILPDLKSDDSGLQRLISACHEHFGWTQFHLTAMNKNINSFDICELNSYVNHILSPLINLFGNYFTNYIPSPMKNLFVHYFINYIPSPMKNIFGNDFIYKAIQTKDRDGFTPLHYAAKTCGRSKFLMSLFSKLKTTNLNDKNQLYDIFISKDKIDHRTPLHWAVYNGDFDSASVLLKTIQEIGFDQEKLFNIVSSCDKHDGNLLTCIADFIHDKHYFECLKLIFKFIKYCNFSPQQNSMILTKSDNLLCKLTYKLTHSEDAKKAALYVLSCLEDLPLQDSDRTKIVSTHYKVNSDNTPLHETVKAKSCKVFLSLLRNGAVFNAYNKFRRTPSDVFIGMKRYSYICDKLKMQPEDSFALYSAEGLSENLKEEFENLLKLEILLDFLNKLFELIADEQILKDSVKLSEFKQVLTKIKKETWIDPESLLNARNREGKTLLELSKYPEVTRLLQELKLNMKIE